MLQHTLPAGFIAPCVRSLAFPFRAAYVPAVSPAYPSKKLSRPLLTKDGRRVLELLVGSARQGCTEAFLLAHGFTVDLLADMVRAGFASACVLAVSQSTGPDCISLTLARGGLRVSGRSDQKAPRLHISCRR